MLSSLWPRWRNPIETAPEIFPSWDEAQQRCSDGGFKSEARAASMYSRAKAYYGGTAFPAAPWYLTAAFCPALLLASENRSELRVLDFGGMAGNLYYLAAALLPLISIKWAVVETEPMARHAEMDSSKPAALRFFTSIGAGADWLGAVDLTHSSGAIQYTPQPMSVIRGLIELDAPVLALQRCAVAIGETFVTIQRSKLSANMYGPLPSGFQDCDVSNPVTFLNRDEFMGVIAERYYRLLTFENSDGEVLRAQRAVRLDEAFVWRLSGKRVNQVAAQIMR